MSTFERLQTTEHKQIWIIMQSISISSPHFSINLLKKMGLQTLFELAQAKSPERKF